jgi:large subunit ribosomal protein L27
MATKKAGGSTSLGRDSQSKRLGLKVHDGQMAKPGMVLVRQRGSKFRAGTGAAVGVDDTVFSTANGKVSYISRTVKSFSGKRQVRRIVTVK